MAAITGITAVRPTANTLVRRVLYGATLAAGQPVYLDAADNEHKLADANDTLAKAAIVGVTITPGVDGGYGYIAVGGSIVLVGATGGVVGQPYVVSATAGSITEHNDLTTGQYVSKVGTLASSTEMVLNIEATGIAHA